MAHPALVLQPSLRGSSSSPGRTGSLWLPIIAAVTPEDDEAEADRRRAARERDRLELEIDRLRAALDERSAALARARETVAQLQADPLISIYRRARRLAGRLRRHLLGHRRPDPQGRHTMPSRRPVAAVRPDGFPVAETAAPTRRDASVPTGHDAGRGGDAGIGRSLRIALAGETAGIAALAEAFRRLRPDWSLVSTDLPSDVALIIGSKTLDRTMLTPVRFALDPPGRPEWLDDIEGVVTTGGDRPDELAAEIGRCGWAQDPGTLVTWIETELRRPRAAIHIGPPDWDRAENWGDLHFGRGLAAALRRQGWAVSLMVAAEAEHTRALAADLAIHVVGRRRPIPHPDKLNVLWIISHPDDARAAVCERHDVVFVASDPFAAALQDRVSVPVLPLHQATDPRRFFPEPGGPPHELLFVGNSRNRRRPVLDALADSARDLAVYGTNWRPEWLPPERLHGKWIANRDLHRYYAASAIVLNDHWPDMRDEGFLSNRLYDALASGAFVLSDEVPGIAAEFDRGVATWTDAASLRAAVERFLADPQGRAEIAERGRRAVLARHTFDHRASTLLDALAPLARARGTRWPEPGANPPSIADRAQKPWSPA